MMIKASSYAGVLTGLGSESEFFLVEVSGEESWMTGIDNVIWAKREKGAFLQLPLKELLLRLALTQQILLLHFQTSYSMYLKFLRCGAMF